MTVFFMYEADRLSTFLVTRCNQLSPSIFWFFHASLKSLAFLPFSCIRIIPRLHLHSIHIHESKRIQICSRPSVYLSPSASKCPHLFSPTQLTHQPTMCGKLVYVVLNDVWCQFNSVLVMNFEWQRVWGIGEQADSNMLPWLKTVCKRLQTKCCDGIFETLPVTL